MKFPLDQGKEGKDMSSVVKDGKEETFLFSRSSREGASHQILGGQIGGKKIIDLPGGQRANQ